MITAFEWFFENFDERKIRTRKILTPHHQDFPIRYAGDDQSAYDTLAIVAGQMELDPASIHLTIYTDGHSHISTGSPLGTKLYLQADPRETAAAGLYWGREEDGKFHIWLERRKLNTPENMVATLAHEIAHIKLLGEGRLEENNERLTDLTTIAFGLGIFNANAAFQFYRGFNSWGYSRMGYLNQMEWGFSLALLALIQGDPQPDWIKFLSSKNIQSDFKKSIQWLQHNPPPFINQ